MVGFESLSFLTGLLGGPVAPTDLLRVLVAVPVFLYASYRDIKERRVRDEVWILPLCAGLLLLLVDFLTGDVEYLSVVAGSNLLFCTILGVLLFRYRWFYGADMKALIVLGLLFPTYPLLGAFPAYAPPAPTGLARILHLFGLTLMANTAIVSVLYPAHVVGSNVINGVSRDGVSIWRMFVAKKIPLEEAHERHGKIIETWSGPSDWTPTRTSLKLICKVSLFKRMVWFFLSGLHGLDAKFLRDYIAWRSEVSDEPPSHFGEIDNPSLKQFLDAQGEGWETDTLEDDQKSLDELIKQEEVWIVPGIPFLVPMTLGLFLSLTVGDLVWMAILSVN